MAALLARGRGRPTRAPGAKCVLGSECAGPGVGGVGCVVPVACRADRVASVPHGLECPVHGTSVHRPVNPAGQPVAVARLGRGACPSSDGGEPAECVGSRGRTALSDLDRLADAALALDVLTLRIDQAVRAIQDRYGLEKAAALLVALREGFAASGFGAEDLARASVAAEMDINALLGDWLGATAMPGFPSLDRRGVPDPRCGRRQAELPSAARHTQQRADAWPGPADVCHQAGVGALGELRPDPDRRQLGSPHRGGPGLPPEAVWVRTYLSRNRAEMRLPVASVDRRSR